MYRYATIAIVCCALAACDNKPTDASDPATATSENTQTTGAARAPEPEAPPEPAISESAAGALVTDWVDAQNAGNFESYKGLYAPKFEGIKRVGARKSSFAREGWLEDRKRMFGKKMNVTADGLEVSTAGTTAVARFTQTWESGSFKDVGPKQLVLIATDEGPRITREEMLASTMVGSDNETVPYEPRKAAVVLDDTYVALQIDASALKTGTPRVLSRSGDAIADVDEAPAHLTAFVGETFVVERTRKFPEPCRTTIESLHVLARAVPHFGQVQYWNGEMGEPRLSDEQVAQEIWKLAAGQGHIVVGKLAQKCDGAVWAHSPETEVTPLTASPGSGALKDQLVEAFRGLAGHTAIQKHYESFDGKGPWSQSGTNVTTYASGDQTYAFIWANAGDGCGEFMGEFWAVYEVSKDGNLVLLSDPSNGAELVIPEAAALVGGDLVLHAPTGQIRKVGTVWRHTPDTSVPYFDCPC